MRTLLVGDCRPDHLFKIKDPSAPTEAEFECAVVKALSCVYADYRCIMFGGTFILDGRGSRPDLALVAKDLSHWFVVEVEIVAHSFEGHVLPQVRAFRYGEPQPDCANILANQLGIDVGQAETVLHLVPRSVAVIANKRDPKWEIGLRALDVQLLVVTVFGSSTGVIAYDVDGALSVTEESLGFGKYSAIDRSIRFARSVQLLDGEVEIDEPSGATAVWIVARTLEAAWLTKKVGRPDIPHSAYVMLARVHNGRIVFRLPWNSVRRTDRTEVY